MGRHEHRFNEMVATPDFAEGGDGTQTSEGAHQKTATRKTSTINGNDPKGETRPHPRVPREISDPASTGNRAVTGMERNENIPTTTNAGQKSDHLTLA